MSLPRIQSSSRVALYLNGKLYAQVKSFDFTSSNGAEELRGIDVPYPIELAPTTISVAGSIGLYRILGDGGAEGMNAMSQPIDIASEKYSTLILLDIFTDTVIFRSDYTKITQQSWSVPAKSIMTGQLSFTGIIYNNDSVT